MVMPLDLFITPYTPVDRMPTAGAGYKALGDFGRDLSERAYRDKQFAEGQRQFDQKHALDVEQQKDTRAYHTDLIDARREASRNALESKRDAKVSALLAQMRKSANANRWDEVDSIRQELTRMGYATEESDTEFEPPEAEASKTAAALAPDVPSPKIPAAQVPKPDKKFAGALAAEMGKDDPFGLGGPSIEASDPTGSPFPWEDHGIAPAPKKKGPGGRFTTRDAQGNLVQTMDVPMEMEKDRQSIELALAPYIDDPQNPESQGAARRASQVAQKAIATGMSPDKALQLGIQSYKTEMQRYKGQRLPSAQPTGGGGVSKQEQQMGVQTFDKTLAAVKEGRAEQVIAKARTDLSEAEQMEGMLSDPEKAFSNRAAMMDWLHAKIGSAQTRTELNNALGGAGAIAKLQMDLNNWTDGGRMPDEIRRGLLQVVQASKQTAQKRIDDAGASAADFLRETLPDFVSPEKREKMAGAASNFLTGKKKETSTDSAREELNRRTREMLKGYK